MSTNYFQIINWEIGQLVMCTTYVAKEIPGIPDYILDTHLIEYTWQAFNHSSNLIIHYFAQPNNVEIIIKHSMDLVVIWDIVHGTWRQ